jgi:hypothetical protein
MITNAFRISLFSNNSANSSCLVARISPRCAIAQMILAPGWYQSHPAEIRVSNYRLGLVTTVTGPLTRV